LPSAESERIRSYFARIEANLASQGLLRTDTGARDRPFSEAQLVENFVRIALYDEYVIEDGRLVARATPSFLRRWQGPVRVGIEFGPTVPLSDRARDLAEISAFVARLARVTGRSVRMDNRNPNFTILILNEDERRAAGPRLRGLLPRITAGELDAITGMSEEDYCLVIALTGASDAVYTRAVAVLRGEHPPTLRRLCVHEELAQGLGLVNDSPEARPSIFNDDEEFALLTRHDELLLRILYDDRLKPGMTAGEARPIVAAIAKELLGGGT
jgi:hypothetical protein